ncbi:MAG: 50S ribosomal protein L25/general stress protein Ctc [Bacteroidetes bacterium]|nr:50S ribosomal protein L25/general stress protein Ctc [Bacteroidota bacterium]
MKTVSMSGSLRENVGKKDAKKHRREGKIPCVLYGGEKQVHFVIDDMDFSKIIFTPEVFIINLKIDDKDYTAILQDVQYHPVTDRVLHADFLQVLEGKPVIIGVPVKFEGTAPGIIKGGKLRKKMRKLVVKGLVDDLPDYITLSINKLDLNDNIKVKDVSYPKLELLDNPNGEIVGVKTGRGAGMDEPEEEEEEGEEGAEEGAEGEEGAPAEGEGGEAPKEGGE